jgi:hypothetical protein
MSANRQVVLAARPQGWPTEANFALVTAPIPEPQAGEVLVRNQACCGARISASSSSSSRSARCCRVTR